MPVLDRSPTATHTGPFTKEQATRLLWRAGFGPTPGQARAVAALGLDGAVASLTRPKGRARLIGAPPRTSEGQPLDPINVWGNDHCWWLDRMVRSDQQLIERMTLIWHSWFATSIETSDAQLMLAQNRMMRARALGNFHDLLAEVTRDPAMLMWLSGTDNTKYSPNENYAREVMELFTLGADRGAYTQRDVREQARALTGFTNDWSDSAGPRNFRFDATLHDDGVKLILGHRGRFSWRDSCRLCVEHRLHPSFLVAKLWGYFIGVPVPSKDARALARTYVHSGFAIRPLVEAILRHPLFYEGPRMVIPPIVYTAGLLRAQGLTITTDDWAWIGEQSGQRLFAPPNVAGWDYAHWLDTSRWAGRFSTVTYAMKGRALDPESKSYPSDETAEQALASALAYWGGPRLSTQTQRNLLAFAGRVEQRDHGTLGAGHLPYPAPERASRARPDIARLADLLMHHPRHGCCDGFTRSEAIRGALATGRRRPSREWDPRMPVPAGTGIDRRRFLAGAAGGLLSVYGAERLGLTPRLLGEGIAEAAQGPTSPVLVSIFLAGGIDSLSMLAPIGDPLYAKLRPTLAVPEGAGLPFAEDPRLHWHPSAASFAGLHAAGKVTVFPGIGYRGQDAHDLRIRRLRNGRMTGGAQGVAVTQSGALGSGAWHLGPGRYELYCSLPGHRMHGMHTNLVVR